MFGRNKYNKNQKFFNSAQCGFNFNDAYEKGKITKEQYINSMSLDFARFAIMNEYTNLNILDDSANSKAMKEEAEKAVERLSKLDNPSEGDITDKMMIYLMGQFSSDRTTHMEQKDIYYSGLGVFYINLVDILPELSSREIYHKVFEISMSEEAIEFVKNNEQLRNVTTRTQTNVDPETFFEEKYIDREYKDFLGKKSVFLKAWLIGERMSELIKEGKIDNNNRAYFDEDGFAKDENGNIIEHDVSKAFKSTVIIDTKGFERLLFQ